MSFSSADSDWKIFSHLSDRWTEIVNWCDDNDLVKIAAF